MVVELWEMYFERICLVVSVSFVFIPLVEQLSIILIDQLLP
jgi:hypothetical protein